jgi:hypothetical protein
MMSEPSRPTAEDPWRNLGELAVTVLPADVDCLAGVDLVR